MCRRKINKPDEGPEKRQRLPLTKEQEDALKKLDVVTSTTARVLVVVAFCLSLSFPHFVVFPLMATHLLIATNAMLVMSRKDPERFLEKKPYILTMAAAATMTLLVDISVLFFGLGQFSVVSWVGTFFLITATLCLCAVYVKFDVSTRDDNLSF